MAKVDKDGGMDDEWKAFLDAVFKVTTEGSLAIWRGVEYRLVKGNWVRTGEPDAPVGVIDKTEMRVELTLKINGEEIVSISGDMIQSEKSAAFFENGIEYLFARGFEKFDPVRGEESRDTGREGVTNLAARGEKKDG